MFIRIRNSQRSKVPTEHMLRRAVICLIALLALVGMATAQENDLVCLKSIDEQNLAAQAPVLELMNDMDPVFRAFPEYRDLLVSEGTSICLSANMYDARGYFSPEENSIVLQIDLLRPMQVAILIHELRHLQQYATGNCPTDSLAMSEYARAHFALEADASAISLFIANSLKDAGYPAIWEALSTWPTHKDIAAIFEIELATSGDLRRATSAAFAQWYGSSWRRENYYRASCSSYLDRQDTTKLLPQYQELSSEFLKRLCRMPDGSPYECKAESDAHRP